MGTDVSRLLPFALVSTALHAAVLVMAGPEPLALASAPTGDGRSVAVRLVAAGAPDSEPMATDGRDGSNDVGPAAEQAASAPAESGSESEATGADETAPDRADDHAHDRDEADPEAVGATKSTDTGTRETAEYDARDDTASDAQTSETAPDGPADAERSEERADTDDGARMDAAGVAEARGDTAGVDDAAEVEDAEPARAPAPEPDSTSERTTRAESGSGGGDAGHDTASARAESVRADVAAELARHFRYPRLARSRGWEGQVVLTFRVHPDGRLSDIRVRESSGRAILDEAAVRALEQVERVPGLAQDSIGTSLSLTLPVTYRLQSA